MIRLVWGQGQAQTAKASFDVALADAGVHEFNLRTLSSVIPADVQLEECGTAPDLGEIGDALEVVIARQTSRPGARASAGLAWARRGGDGPGIFYECGNHDPETVTERLAAGIERGCRLRDMDPDDADTQIITADGAPDRYTTAVVLAVYGDGRPLL